MGTLVGNYARNVLVSGTETNTDFLLLVMPFINTVIGLFLMRGFLVVMGL